MLLVKANKVIMQKYFLIYVPTNFQSSAHKEDGEIRYAHLD